MQAEIDWIVNDPIARQPEKVKIRYGITENVITKSEIGGQITSEQVKLFRLCGLNDNEIKAIVGFLRS